MIPGDGWNIRTRERHGEAGRPHGKPTRRAREGLNIEGRAQAQRKAETDPHEIRGGRGTCQQPCSRMDTHARGYPPRKGKVGV